LERGFDRSRGPHRKRPGAELAIDVKESGVSPKSARLGVVAGTGVSIDASAVVPAGTLI
jgi:hypothetical protein